MCSKKVVYIEEPRCKICSKPVSHEEKELCADCEEKRHYFIQGKSVWLHKGIVRQSVYRFKYHNRRIYGEFYAKELFRLYENKLKEWEIDAIVPIPLHWKKKRKRGYNQALILAKHLGRLSGIPVKDKMVKRIRNTRPQKELEMKDRKKNVQNAFELYEPEKGVKSILLVDDIYTTGNTIDAVAKLFVEKGMYKVFFFTISIGQGF